jgi:DNA-binding transcriptional regulator YhcF (GntR family)
MPALEIDFTRFKKRSDLPEHRQVAAYLKAIIALGQLNPGDSVPGIPALAYRLHVSPGEVKRAYAELSDRGFLLSQAGKWKVSDRFSAVKDDDQVADICERLWDLILEARKAGLSRAELQRMFDQLTSRS